jgi:hypothetical protein
MKRAGGAVLRQLEARRFDRQHATAGVRSVVRRDPEGKTRLALAAGRFKHSQEASELIVQLHSRALVTAMLPEPPAYGKERGAALADTSHFVALGAVVEVDADVQPVTNRTRPANAAVHHRTLRQPQIACQPETTALSGCARFARNLTRPTRRRRALRFLTSVRTPRPPPGGLRRRPGSTPV